MNRVAIVGYGKVGQCYGKVFPDAVIYDKSTHFFPSISDGKLYTTQISKVNEWADMAIVCVPTPEAPDGSCDTSIVEEVVKQLEVPLILIKSTVTPGTTDRLREATGKSIAHSPEFVGEGGYFVPPPYPDPVDPRQHGFCILGGTEEDCTVVAGIMAPALGPFTRFRFVTAKESETIKLVENAFIATKITFCNEMYDLCEALGVNWYKVREGWLDDARVGLSHTAVYPHSRGFKSSRCLAKDVPSLVHVARSVGIGLPLLESVGSALKASGNKGNFTDPVDSPYGKNHAV